MTGTRKSPRWWNRLLAVLHELAEGFTGSPATP